MMVGSWNRYAAKGAELVHATDDHKPGSEVARVQIGGGAQCRSPPGMPGDEDDFKVYLPGIHRLLT